MLVKPVSFKIGCSRGTPRGASINPKANIPTPSIRMISLTDMIRHDGRGNDKLQ